MSTRRFWVLGRSDGSRVGRLHGLSTAARTVLSLIAALAMMPVGQVLADQPLEGAAAEVPPPPATWSMNLFDPSVVRFQNPDPRACTAAATESMLNLISLASYDDPLPPRGSSLPRISFRWRIDSSYDTQENILEYERENMTMVWSSPGSDPHGWRNALNYYGWGSMDADVYVDSAFSSFDEAARAVVQSIARNNKPAGILGWAGGHAQYVTGYSVVGDDPRVSDNYTILGVFLTDPLEADWTTNVFIPYDTWQGGPGYIRFWQYWQPESPYQDPIDGQVGYYEWWGKWVIIDAVK
jgi:methylmalonyl-CoA mutase cobalamin-binding subunit